MTSRSSAHLKPLVVLLSDEPEQLSHIAARIERLGHRVIIIPTVCEGIVDRYYTDGYRDPYLIESRIVREPLSVPFFTVLRDSPYAVHSEADLKEAIDSLKPAYIVMPPKLEAVNFDGRPAHVEKLIRETNPAMTVVHGNMENWVRLLTSAQQKGRRLI